MTTLTKARTFKVNISWPVGRDRSDLIIQLDPAGMIRFREPRRRTWLEFPLARIYHLAALASADELRAARKRRRRGEA